MYTPCIVGIMLVAELLVAVKAERQDYVDFFEERKKEVAVNATRLNSTAAHAPNSREGSIAEAFDKILENEFPDKEDPQEGTSFLGLIAKT